MSRRTLVAVAAGLAAAGLVVAVGLSPTASAGVGPASVRDGGGAAGAELDTVAPDMLAAIQTDLGLSAHQVRQRLTKQRKANEVDTAIKSSLGSRYAGSWLAGGETLTVAVTDRTAADLVRKAGARPVLVSHSAAQLDSARARLDAAAGQVSYKRVAGWQVDAASNAVKVLVRPGGAAAARAFVKAAGIDPALVRYVATTLNPRPFIDVIGGNAYFIGSSTRCSVGFSVVGGFVTAGHCGRVGSPTSQPSGSFAGSQFPGNDYAWVRVNAGNTPRPLVNAYPGTITVNGSSQAPVGSTVCRSGSTTGRHCGRVVAYNSTVNYPQGTVTGLIRTTVCAEPGDSGGSLLWNDQAQGVTSGGSGNCSSGGTTFFQPVNEILQVFGLQLLTGNGTPPTTTPPTTPPDDPPPGDTTWAPFTAYTVGQTVLFEGVRYTCRQSHTSLPGWEPPIVLALWLPS